MNKHKRMLSFVSLVDGIVGLHVSWCMSVSGV